LLVDLDGVLLAKLALCEGLLFVLLVLPVRLGVAPPPTLLVDKIDLDGDAVDLIEADLDESCLFALVRFVLSRLGRRLADGDEHDEDAAELVDEISDCGADVVVV